MASLPSTTTLLPGESQQITTSVPNAVYTIDQPAGANNKVDQSGLFTAGSNPIGAVVRIHTPFWKFYRASQIGRNPDDTLYLNNRNPRDNYANMVPNGILTAEYDYIEWHNYYQNTIFGVDIGLNGGHNLFIDSISNGIRFIENVRNVAASTRTITRLFPWGSRLILRLRSNKIQFWHENELIYTTVLDFIANGSNRFITHFGGWPLNPQITSNNGVGSKWDPPRFFGSGIKDYSEERVSFCVVAQEFDIARKDAVILQVDASTQFVDSAGFVQSLQNNHESKHPKIDGSLIPGLDRTTPTRQSLRMGRATRKNDGTFYHLQFKRRYPSLSLEEGGACYKFTNLLNNIIDSSSYAVLQSTLQGRDFQSIKSFPNSTRYAERDYYPNLTLPNNETGLSEGFGRKNIRSVYSNLLDFPDVDRYRLLSIRSKIFDWQWALDHFLLHQLTDDDSVPSFRNKDFYIGGSAEYVNIYHDLGSFNLRQWVIYNTRLNDAEHDHNVRLLGEAYKLDYSTPLSSFTMPAEITVGQSAMANFEGLGGFSTIIWRVNGVVRRPPSGSRHLNVTPYLTRGENIVELELDGQYGKHVSAKNINYKTQFFSIPATLPSLSRTVSMPDGINIEVAARAVDTSGNRSDYTTESIKTPAPSGSLSRRSLSGQQSSGGQSTGGRK
jgi:hypothetical protein